MVDEVRVERLLRAITDDLPFLRADAIVERRLDDRSDLYGFVTAVGVWMTRRG